MLNPVIVVRVKRSRAGGVSGRVATAVVEVVQSGVQSGGWVRTVSVGGGVLL